MPKPEARVHLLHPDAKSAPRIDRSIYDGFRSAILRAIPRGSQGLAFLELPDKVETLLPKAVRGAIGSVSWYTTTIKLDLEARGEIERVPGATPQRLRRRK
jgi:hypothetical protein